MCRAFQERVITGREIDAAVEVVERERLRSVGVIPRVVLTPDGWTEIVGVNGAERTPEDPPAVLVRRLTTGKDISAVNVIPINRAVFTALVSQSGISNGVPDPVNISCASLLSKLWLFSRLTPFDRAVLDTGDVLADLAVADRVGRRC